MEFLQAKGAGRAWWEKVRHEVACTPGAKALRGVCVPANLIQKGDGKSLYHLPHVSLWVMMEEGGKTSERCWEVTQKEAEAFLALHQPKETSVL